MRHNNRPTSRSCPHPTPRWCDGVKTSQKEGKIARTPHLVSLCGRSPDATDVRHGVPVLRGDFTLIGQDDAELLEQPASFKPDVPIQEMNRDELATQIFILGLTGRDPKEQFTSTRHISRKDGRTSDHQPTGRAGRHSRSQSKLRRSPDCSKRFDCGNPAEKNKSPDGWENFDFENPADHNYPQSRTGLRSTSMQLKKVCHEGSYGIKWPGDPRRRARGTGCERSAITAGISSRCSEEELHGKTVLRGDFSMHGGKVSDGEKWSDRVKERSRKGLEERIREMWGQVKEERRPQYNSHILSRAESKVTRDLVLSRVALRAGRYNSHILSRAESKVTRDLVLSCVPVRSPRGSACVTEGPSTHLQEKRTSDLTNGKSQVHASHAFESPVYTCCHGHGFEFYTFDKFRAHEPGVLLRASVLRLTEENSYDTMSNLRKRMTWNDLSQVETQEDVDLSLSKSTLRKLTNENDEGKLKPGQEGDAASSFSESANVSKLVRGYEALTSQSYGAASSRIPTHALPDTDRALISLRPSDQKIKAELEQLTEQPTSAAGVVTGTPPPKPPRLHHGDDTPVPAPESARCGYFVLYRLHNREWYRFLASDDHILEELFGDGEELHRLYFHCEATARESTLPVGRLDAIDDLPVRGLTSSELLDVVTTSVDPDFWIKPLEFELITLEGLASEQELPSEDEESGDEEETEEQQVRPVRKRGRLAAFFSRCRRALTSCWRR
ncbi:hypothetical protein Bbelb_075380 [Branchiostoma belcheri]|nr:hypothetical protein Bbelb_075380 [Branchiostoma belcheri]